MNPGEVVADRFEIERRIASGGMGHIYLARDRASGQKVAFKLLHGHATERPVRFQREVEALLALQHPSIVRYVANGSTARGVPWLAMKWLEGVTLGERLAKGPLGIEESLEIGAGLATALAVVHAQGLVHRDLKPSNIFLVGGQTGDVKLIDFGLVRPGRGGRSELTAPGMVLGTVGYLAPEQARGEPFIDARADVFAFGCVLFRCVTGKRPFVGDDDLSILLKIIVEEPPRLRDLRMGVPAALDELVARMLSKAPIARPADGAAVAAAIAALGAGGPATTRSRKPEIGARERRVMALVLARDLSFSDAREKKPIDAGPPGDTQTPALIGQRLAGEIVGRLNGTVERHRGQLELLADGSSLVVFTSDGEATDLAARAARCALSVRALWPSVPIVVVSGRAEPSERHLVGELIDRAVALLPGVRLGSIPPPGAAGMVRVDDVSVGLLGPGFILQAGGWLSGERESVDTPRTLLGKPTPCVGRERDRRPGGRLRPQRRGAGGQRRPGHGARGDRQVAARRRAAPPPPRARGRAADLDRARRSHERRILVRPARAGAPPGAGPRRGPLDRRAPAPPPRARGAGGDAPGRGRARGRLPRRAAGHALPGRHAAPRGAARSRAPRRPDAPRLGRLPPRRVRRPPPGPGARGSPLGGPAHHQVRRRRPPPPGDAALPGARARPPGGAPGLPRSLDRAQRRGGPPEPPLAARRREPGAQRAGGRRLRRGGNGPRGAGRRQRPLSRRADPGRRRGAGRGPPRDGAGHRAGPPGGAPRRGAPRPPGGERLRADLPRGGRGRAAGRSPRPRLDPRPHRAGGGRPRGRRRLPLPPRAGARGLLRDAHRRRPRARPPAGRRVAGGVRRARRHGARRALRAGAGVPPRRRLVPARRRARLRGQRSRRRAGPHPPRPGLRRGSRQPARRRADAGPHQGLPLAGPPPGRRGQRALGHAPLPRGRLALVRGRRRGGPRRRQARPHRPAHRLRRGAPGRRRDRAHPRSPRRRARDRPAEPRSAPTFADREVAASYAIALARAATSLRLSAGRQALVEVLLERADAAAERAAGDPEVVGQVLWARSLRVLAAGDVSAFLELVQSSQASLELAGDLRSACVQALNAGHGFLQLGLYEEAARIFRETADRAERLGLGNARSYARLNLGPALAGLGQLAEARAAEEDAIALFRAQSDRPLESTARTYLALILSLLGERAAAAREATAVADDRGATPAIRALALTLVADLHLVEGRAAEALAAAEGAVSLLTSLDGIEEGEALIRVVYAEALHASGDLEGARSALRDARDRLLARAQKVVSPVHRRSFLERVPENARTMARAAEWLGG